MKTEYPIGFSLYPWLSMHGSQVCILKGHEKDEQYCWDPVSMMLFRPESKGSGVRRTA